jgi:hypothetical protein
MWSYDIAREQCPRLDHLMEIATMTADAGYNALGLYLEHRFAFPSAPWAHGKGAITPETVRTLQSEFPSLQLVPMINLLGHMEGFLYTERGKSFREERFKGMQACPSNSEFVRWPRFRASLFISEAMKPSSWGAALGVPTECLKLVRMDFGASTSDLSPNEYWKLDGDRQSGVTCFSRIQGL